MHYALFEVCSKILMIKGKIWAHRPVIKYLIGFCSLPFFLTRNVPSREWYNHRKSSALNPSLMPEAITLTEKTY